jgi:DNA-binding NarL/FixJ family response regulator
VSAPSGKRSVLVVDDHDVVQWGFRVLLARQPWVERCLVARTPDEAVELARRYEPDVALVDLFLGNRSGAELGHHIQAASARTRVLLMSGAGWISPQAAKTAGAAGFVPKDWSGDDLARAVRKVAEGGTVFVTQSDGPEVMLTGREREVLALMAGGSTNGEIAAELHLSAHTIKEYTSSLYRKLEVRNRAEAVARSERLGLVKG